MYFSRRPLTSVLGETGQRAPNHLVQINNINKEFNLGETKAMRSRGIGGCLGVQPGAKGRGNVAL